MIRLIILLLGADALRREWTALAALGGLWTGLGLLVVGDAADGVNVLATEAFGWFVLVDGALGVFFALTAGRSASRFFLVKALALLTLGLIIVDMPWRNHLANSALFGLAFAIDGAMRIAAAWTIRFRRWRVVVAGGAFELVMAALAFSNWPVSHERTVPFSVGVLLLLSGWAVLRAALELRKLRPGASLTLLRSFGRLDPAWGGPAAPDAKGEPALVVHVWTPLGTAREPQRRPLIDRYVAAVDRRGRISTGHSALEVAPDLYISHYPAVEIDREPSEILRAVRATPENDVPGRFLPSYDAEVADWCPADAHVTFRRFDEERLRTFWAAYRRDGTYNLMGRNCTGTVAHALDAALEGVLGDGPAWRRVLRLAINPDLWLAAVLRVRAESMVWTPGLMLDYARALHRVVEPPPVRWWERLRGAIEEFRRMRSRPEGKEAVETTTA